MSLATKENGLAVSDFKLPSPSDLCLGQISLKNCKDATIGTKIDGNVIVNQYFNDIPLDKVAAEGLAFTDSVVLEDWIQKLLRYKYVWISMILAVVVTTVLCILYIPRSQHQDDTDDVPMFHNFTKALLTRQHWSKSHTETPCQLFIESPARYVVIGHTVTLPCHNPLACETTVTLIQKDEEAHGRCDISYNFVIGDDGYIYEGRGWTKLGTKSLSFSCSSLGIGLVGNFNLNQPSDIMINSLNLLLKEGVSLDVTHSLNYTLKLRTRYNWSIFRAKLKDCDTLKVRPAKYVVVGHTVSKTCQSPAACEAIMTSIQSDHIRKGFCDIGYTFLIGDDGYIYEGRGWGKYGAHTYGFNCDSIGVGLIGNFQIDVPSSDMLDMLQLLIEEGLRINEISLQYKLIFQSQANQKLSPGIHVEEVLKKWDHWSNITAEDMLC